jgi:hypothetical protein
MIRRRRVDAFARVVGERRGRGQAEAREPETDLARARELAARIAEDIEAEDMLAATRDLRRRADELGVDVHHGAFTATGDEYERTGLTLLIARRGGLIGVVAHESEGAQLFRPDQTRWTL